jgi:creatinine amidohydrolase
MPALDYGKSNEHWHFPGTITLSAQTLLAVLMDVAESVYRAGFRKLVFMNSHGGQPQIIEIAARDLHQKYEDFIVFPLFTWKVPKVPIELMTPKELALGIHAGDAETSLLLSILPDQVKMDRAVAEYPDLSKSGVLGDPLPATKEKGDRLLEALANGWVDVIKEVYTFRQPQAWH